MFGEKARLRTIAAELERDLSIYQNAQVNLKRTNEVLRSGNTELRNRVKWLTEQVSDILKSQSHEPIRKIVEDANKEIEQMQLVMDCIVDTSECESAMHTKRVLTREKIVAEVEKVVGVELK